MLLGITFAIQQDVFILNLKYNKGEISTDFLTVAKGYFHESVNQPDNAYRLELISFDDKILYTQKFDFQLEVFLAPFPEWFDEKGNQIYIPNENETRIIRDTADIELLFPYFDNAKRIDIYDNKNQLKLSIDVNDVSGKCNSDGKCDNQETPQNCPQDCHKQSKKTEDKRNKFGNYIIYSALLIVIVMAIIFQIYLKNRYRSKIP